MRLNTSLNEKMSTIYDHLKDVVEKGFDILRDKNATIPEIETLETLIQSIEKFPNIEPIPNRYYKWTAVEAISFGNGSDDILPEVFNPDEVKGMLYDEGYFYMFYEDAMYMAINGFNFGKECTDLNISHGSSLESLVQHNTILWFSKNLSLFDDTGHVEMVLISYDLNKLYIDYVLNGRKYELEREFDSNIVSILKYTINNKLYLLVASINTLICMSTDELFNCADTKSIEDFNYVEFPFEDEITNLIMLDKSLFITFNSSYVAELEISESDFLILTQKKKWGFIETPKWLYMDHSTKILYGFSEDGIMRGIEIAADIETSLDNVKPININIINNQSIQIDLLNGFFEHKNYIVLLSVDAVYISQYIQTTVTDEIVLNAVRIDFPPALGVISKMFIMGDILYLLGIGGQMYGLSLPDTLGNPILASRASYIANGMTGIISKGAIGKDIEGITWKYRGELPKGYTYKYASANQFGLILAENKEYNSYQLYSIYENGENITKLTDSIPELIIDEINPSKLFFVASLDRFYIFTYYRELERAIVYYSGGDYKLWIPYEVTEKTDMLEIFKNMRQVYASEESGFLIDSPNIVEGFRFAVMGPNLECLDNPYSTLSMIQPMEEVVCSGYEDEHFFIVYQNTIGMVFQLRWDINITGQITCRIINKKLTKVESPIKDCTIFLGEFVGLSNHITYSSYLGNSNSDIHIVNFDKSNLHLYRLAHSLLLKSESDDTLLLSYDGLYWEELNPLKLGLPIIDSDQIIDFQHDKNKNIMFIDNYCYSNGFTRDTYQKYFTYNTTFNLSKNNGQFHYHFEFSPRFVFFTIEFLDELEANLIGGYISKEPITNYNLKSAMFEGYVNESGNFKMRFFTEEPLNDLTGQDLILMIDNYKDYDRDYQITLYAFA